VRLCVDHLRKRRPATVDEPVVAEKGPTAEQHAVFREQARAIRVAIDRLPSKQRTTVVLRYYEGLDGRETAAAMETSVKAVERLLARARKTLEARLRDFLQE